MTTDIKCIVSPDLYIENNTLLIQPSASSPGGLPLSAITFLAHSVPSTPGRLDELTSAACTAATPFLAKLAAKRNLSTYLFVTDHGISTPISRPQAYQRKKNRLLLGPLYREWKSLLNEMTLCTDELELYDDDRMRFAALFKSSLSLLYPCAQLLRSVGVSALLLTSRAVESNAVVEELFQTITSRSRKTNMGFNWANLIASYCPLGDVVIRCYGEFDDVEVSVDVFFSGDALAEMLKILRVTGPAESSHGG